MLQKFALIVKLSIIISVLSDVKNGSSMYKILSKYCQTGKESSSCNPVTCEICTFNRDEAVLSTSLAPHPGSQVSTYFGPVTQGYRFTQNSDISIERETCEKNKWRMKYWWYCVWCHVACGGIIISASFRSFTIILQIPIQDLGWKLWIRDTLEGKYVNSGHNNDDTLLETRIINHHHTHYINFIC